MGWMNQELNSIPSRARDYSLLHIIQMGYGTHPASCPVGAGNSFPRGKTSGV
jgi:hypothetical protein